ncbi:MAG: hypothetical protein L3K09_06230 [Thermoplasmata archaeon]|nr:hypothetical protein [Thermoplasmata archaeon]
MALHPEEIELSVEKELAPGADGVPRRARLSARFRVSPEGSVPSASELAETLAKLRQDLEGAAGSPAPPVPLPVRADRELTELIEAYRPRQVELLDLLMAEREITEGEHVLLSRHLAKQPKSKPASARSVSSPLEVSTKPEEPPAITDRPIAAAPLAADRTPTTARAVPQLLSEYKIESLRQAGAVRARRQISYEEYMALKRHFSAEPGEPVRPAA